MFKALFGLAPQKEADGSFRPSPLALRLATSATTNYTSPEVPPAPKRHQRIMVLMTEDKDMTMANGLRFSTGNHPVETFVPLLHFRHAGYDIDIVTPTGRPAVIESWALPKKDQVVMGLYEALQPALINPISLESLVTRLDTHEAEYAALFIPGGHGAMLGLPQNPKVDTVLRWAHRTEKLILSICHGPGAFLATTLNEQPFLFVGYRMAAFPDAMDKMTPRLGYLPGHMPWRLCEELENRGVVIDNRKADATCCVDRHLITGASPAASNQLGVLAVQFLQGQSESLARE